MSELTAVWLTAAVIGGILLELSSAIIAGEIAADRRARWAGFLLGFVFGPLGVMMAFWLDRREKCPLCRERVSEDATLCPSCRSHLTWRDSKIISARETVSVIVAKGGMQPPAAVG